MKATWVRPLGQEDLLEKEMATHSNVLAWKIPWTEEPGGLESMGSQLKQHSGGHEGLPEEQFHSPDSDVQTIFRWALASIPSSFLRVFLIHWVCASRLIFPSFLSWSVSTPQPLPPQQDSAPSETLHPEVETTASVAASMVYRNCPAPGPAISRGWRLGPGSTRSLVQRQPRDTCRVAFPDKWPHRNLTHPLAFSDVCIFQWEGYDKCEHKNGLLSGSDGKESACNAGDPGSLPGSERSAGGGNGNPLQDSCLENPMDRGYRPWGHKESDIAEQLTL